MEVFCFKILVAGCFADYFSAYLLARYKFVGSVLASCGAIVEVARKENAIADLVKIQVACNKGAVNEVAVGDLVFGEEFFSVKVYAVKLYGVHVPGNAIKKA